MPLEVRTLILVQEMFDGTALCAPLAQLSLRSYAVDVQEAMVEQETFLEEYLADQRPEVISGFVFPEATALHEVSAELHLPHTSARLQMPGPVTLLAVVVPHGRDRWVVLPALDHTFHMDANDELGDAVAAETRRMMAARELSSLELTRLLPPRSAWLEPLSVTVAQPDEGPAGRARSVRRAAARARRMRDAAEVLESVSTPLHRTVAHDALPPLEGRQEQLEQLAALLSGPKRLSVALVAPARVGKTALMHAWIAAQLQDEDRRPVYATSAAQMVAGMSGLGQWQERVRRVMEAAASLDAVIYFESLADLFGDHAGGMVDIASAMRPFLDEERVRVVGEVRPESLDLLESRHPGFMGPLHRLRIEPLDPEQTARALIRRGEQERERHPDRPRLDPGAVGPLLDLLERYLPYQHNPGKAVALLEELVAMKEATPDAQGAVIGATEVEQAFALQTGIPPFLLRDERALKLEVMIDAIGERVRGQQEAVRRVAEILCVVKARLQPPDRPLASLLFVGPTGVGKTEVARALSSVLFGSDERLTRFDMSEYSDPFAAERLIRGNERGDQGELTRKVRQQPFCVLLLDEVEKADPAVFDLLLQVLGEGRLTDAAGRTAYFNNAIIIMTSNLGAAHRRQPIGLEAAARSDAEYYMEQVRQAFRPELVGRLDRVVPFHALGLEHVRQICGLLVERLELRRGLAEPGVGLEVTPGAVGHLARLGVSEQYGARELRRQLEDLLVTPAAAMLCRHARAARGGRVEVGAAAELDEPAPRGATAPLAEASAGPLRLRLHRGSAGRAGIGSAISRVSELRRAGARLMQLEEVQEVREQIEYLVAQLATRGGGRKRGGKLDPRAARELAELSTEHHQLKTLWERAEALTRELGDVEELCLEATLDEQDPAPYLEEGEALLRQLRAHLFYLLICMQPRLNAVSLLLQELDGGRALDRWLLPLLDDLGRRGWTATLHLDGDRARPGDAIPWPAGRRFGPPRDAAWITEWMGKVERPRANLVLRVRGANVGAALGLEGGVHRYDGLPGRDKPALFMARVLCLRWELGDEEWDHDALAVTTPADLPAVRRRPPRRRFKRPDGPCLLPLQDDEVDMALARYWERFEEIACRELLHILYAVGGELADLYSGALPVKAPGGGGAA